MTLSHWVMSHESYYSDTPKTVLLEILFILFKLHFVTKMARTTETARGPESHGANTTNIACNWSTPHPARSLPQFLPG